MCVCGQDPEARRTPRGVYEFFFFFEQMESGIKDDDPSVFVICPLGRKDEMKSRRLSVV